MTAIQRNVPCPCGSGKKYKHCCLKTGGLNIQNADKFTDENMAKYQAMAEEGEIRGEEVPTFMESLGMSNSATDLTRQIQEAFSSREFNSMEEMQAALTEYNMSRNSGPIDDFLGLSPDQMQQILYCGDKVPEKIVKINTNLDIDQIKDVPIHKLAVNLLNIITDNNDSLKLTQKGNFPIAVVKSLYSLHSDDYLFIKLEPRYEDDAPLITISRHLLKKDGYIRKEHSKIHLTKKALNFLAEKNQTGLFYDLFFSYMTYFNWLFSTRYEDKASFIQQSRFFGFYMLHKKAEKPIKAKELSIIYETAFPQLKRDLPDIRSLSMVQAAFKTLFLEWFCYRFGLISFKNTPNKLEDVILETTPLFKKLFDWKV